MTIILKIFLASILYINFSFADICTGTSISISSWNTKHFGRKSFDYKSAVKLISKHDVIALQEVNKSQSGEDALMKLRVLLEKSTKEKWCSALSDVPTGSRERYAYIWKEKKVAYIKNGKIINKCKQGNFIVSLADKYQKYIVREPAIAAFQIKSNKEIFRFATVHLVPTKKNPENEVPFLFNSFKNLEEWPLIVSGDFNLSSGHQVFDQIKKNGWVNIFSSNEKTSLKMKTRILNKAYDNLWVFNNRKSVKCEVISGIQNTYTSFPNLTMKHVYYKISDHVPIFMKFHQQPARSVASDGEGTRNE